MVEVQVGQHDARERAHVQLLGDVLLLLELERPPVVALGVARAPRVQPRVDEDPLIRGLDQIRGHGEADPGLGRFALAIHDRRRGNPADVEPFDVHAASAQTVRRRTSGRGGWSRSCSFSATSAADGALKVPGSRGAREEVDVDAADPPLAELDVAGAAARGGGPAARRLAAWRSASARRRARRPRRTRRPSARPRWRRRRPRTRPGKRVCSVAESTGM